MSDRIVHGADSRGWTYKDADKHLKQAEKNLSNAKKAKLPKENIDRLKKLVKDAQAIRNQF